MELAVVDLDALRQLDPTSFPPEYPRRVQKHRWPLGFSDNKPLLEAPPGTFKNILHYRNVYYVAPQGTPYPYVGVTKKGHPACFASAPTEHIN